ncbi:Aste57867_2539 [Aphanomyces stellatus]|uniref:Aste57867_2539 protein n=1 Tax=Aphanomyces stellatus TaxID=120398 RepID=A0A485KAA9_9STRA|nr:hypothetical protein As57867_002532 [Aphanomyces stellatus]VFT79736.1 Aste57867_2539 [Aphanomyces stellatus]
MLGTLFRYIPVNLDPAVRNAYLAALFKCTTVADIFGFKWDLSQLDETMLPPALGMRKLNLQQVLLSPTSLSCLAAAICHSTALEGLCIGGLFPAPNCNIEDFDVTNCLKRSRSPTSVRLTSRAGACATPNGHSWGRSWNRANNYGPLNFGPMASQIKGLLSLAAPFKPMKALTA